MAKPITSFWFGQKGGPVSSTGGTGGPGKTGSPPLGLTDSGAQDSLLDEEMAVQAGCSLEPLASSCTTTALDGRITAQVTHRMVPVTLPNPNPSGNHLEQISSQVIPVFKTPMVLIYPWWRCYNWIGGELEFAPSFALSQIGRQHYSFKAFLGRVSGPGKWHPPRFPQLVCVIHWHSFMEEHVGHVWRVLTRLLENY